jgi:hypothetical protein
MMGCDPVITVPVKVALSTIVGVALGVRVGVWVAVGV